MDHNSIFQSDHPSLQLVYIKCQIPSWFFLLHKLCSYSSPKLGNGCFLSQDASDAIKKKKKKKENCRGILSGILFLLLPLSFPFLLPWSHSLLTCTYLCPCLLYPGIKRSTVWTQPMPSKSLAASCLHGMEFLDSFEHQAHTKHC